jgi:5'-3' exoribonuclease 1
MDNRKNASSSSNRPERLAFNNTFPARERTFITNLAQELHLTVRWDEYDEQDENLVTLRLPGAANGEVSNDGTPRGGSPPDDDEGEWEDVDDEESNAAIDRVLKKYIKAPVEDPDAEGTFDERHERSVKEKMDEWKRGYYKVGLPASALPVPTFCH